MFLCVNFYAEPRHVASHRLDDSYRERCTSGVARNCSQGVRNSNPLTPFTVSVESGTLTGEHVITCHTSSMET